MEEEMQVQIYPNQYFLLKLDELESYFFILAYYKVLVRQQHLQGRIEAADFSPRRI